MTTKTTIETITGEQILALYHEAEQASDETMAEDCLAALDDAGTDSRMAKDTRALRACVAAINDAEAQS